MKLESCFSRFVAPAVVLAGVLSFTSAGFAQKAAPDAQIEAGVLKALASAPELSTQGINTTTVYGTVTLSGSVQTEAQRQKAEQLAANAPNVKKVVDELTLGGDGAPAPNQPGPGDGRVLLSDGTYAPADNGQQQSPNPQMSQQQGTPGQPGADEVPPANGPDTDPYGRPLNQGANAQQNTAQQPPNTTPQPGYGYPNQQQPQYPNQYPPQTQSAGQYPLPNRAPYNGPYGAPPQQQQPNGYNQQAPGYGQVGGQTVTIPAGTVLQVRVNTHLSTRDIKAGTPFQAMVVNDIVSNGQVAIPRGAAVQGVVVDSTRSGDLGGRGQLGLQLNSVTLGGQTFPVASDVFTAQGGNKTGQTVNNAVGLGALGALFGAVAGGGAGAAIGAGAGAAVGLGTSAASGRRDAFIPSEAVLSFRIVQPASVVTVSQAELQRLGYGVPAGGPQMVRRYPPPGYYYPAPVYYYPRGYYARPYPY